MFRTEETTITMIGAHAIGIQHTYKKINKTHGKCLVCGSYSACTILSFVKSFHIFYIRIKVLDEQYIFDWKSCNHRAVLHDPEDVDCYKLEQVETGILSIPYYQNMKPGLMAMPQKVPAIQIVLVVMFSLALGVLLVFLFENLGIPFVF